MRELEEDQAMADGFETGVGEPEPIWGSDEWRQFRTSSWSSRGSRTAPHRVK